MARHKNMSSKGKKRKAKRKAKRKDMFNIKVI